MNWLRDIRNEKKYTQREVAEFAGIKRPAYTNIELGVRRPSVDVAKRIAEYLDFEWTYFYPNNKEN